MYKIVDVTGDGSCFYRAIFRVLKEKDALLEGEDAFVKKLREVVSKMALTDKIMKDIYNNLKAMDKRSYKMAIQSSFPSWFSKMFKVLPSTEEEFRKKYSNGVKMMSNWASEVDIRLVKIFMRKILRMKLIVVNKPPEKNLIIKKSEVYVLNRGEVHYNAIIFICEDKKIMNPKTQRCVKQNSCKGYEIRALALKQT
jgi:hypothetical protein